MPKNIDIYLRYARELKERKDKGVTSCTIHPDNDHVEDFLEAVKLHGFKYRYEGRQMVRVSVYRSSPMEVERHVFTVLFVDSTGFQ